MQSRRLPLENSCIEAVEYSVDMHKKKMNLEHTCEGAAGTTGHQATRNWVASIIKEKLKACPDYKPKDIVNDIKQEYGIQLNYFQDGKDGSISTNNFRSTTIDSGTSIRLLPFNPFQRHPHQHTPSACTEHG